MSVLLTAGFSFMYRKARTNERSGKLAFTFYSECS